MSDLNTVQHSNVFFSFSRRLTLYFSLFVILPTFDMIRITSTNLGLIMISGWFLHFNNVFEKYD